MTKLEIFLIVLFIFFISNLASGVELVKGDNPVELRILLQLRWTDFGESQTSIHSETKVYSGFSGRRCEIRFEGSLNAENIKWELMFDPVALSNKIIQDIDISLLYIPYLDIKLGQFKYPQNLDSRTSSGKLFFARRSLIGRTFGDKRDFGIQFGHNFKEFEYAFGWVNGSGRNNPENNNKKDWAARVLIKPVQYLNLGGSIYRGRQPSGVTEREGAELKFNYKNFALQSEYQVGKDSSLERWGLYLQAGYMLGQHFQPCLRGEVWEPAKNNIKDKMYITTFGFNWLLKGENTKISFNYILVTEEDNEIDNNEFIIQWQLSI
ncbi:MAG: hypothetical protein A2145_01205 [candidate division Zixibacteria bacterium RBG_16_40_9]|nr:MAG: hypothetical protein A2145_01205 [candidate division Zixibacteria bacterium RBG_16_40_9]